MKLGIPIQGLETTGLLLEGMQPAKTQELMAKG
jgi:hypothetical protein